MAGFEACQLTEVADAAYLDLDHRLREAGNLGPQRTLHGRDNGGGGMGEREGVGEGFEGLFGSWGWRWGDLVDRHPSAVHILTSDDGPRGVDPATLMGGVATDLATFDVGAKFGRHENGEACTVYRNARVGSDVVGHNPVAGPLAENSSDDIHLASDFFAGFLSMGAAIECGSGFDVGEAGVFVDRALADEFYLVSLLDIYESADRDSIYEDMGVV